MHLDVSANAEGPARSSVCLRHAPYLSTATPIATGAAAVYTLRREEDAMARANRTLIAALRATAARLAAGSRYRWAHQGACNCGHLAQTITRRTREELHRIAVQKAGDWGEHAVDYCPTSGYPIDAVLTEMLDAGLELADVAHLERLSDPAILGRLPREERPLDYRRRDHVVRYLDAWSDLLEARLACEPSGEHLSRPRVGREETVGGPRPSSKAA